MLNNIEKNGISSDGIILFAKRSGFTSFSSLYTIKHALNTKKVGHTGTLDSFACGLLVVCVGKLTKLVSYITEFTKEYEAVVKFGSKTDTLDYTGKIIQEKTLPSEKDLINVVKKICGPSLQVPPDFSAIHVNGQRASDLVRQGKSVTIPPRKIIVYKSEIIEVKKNGDSVSYARIRFLVSKGTYIRSLVRDIAEKCNSTAHLIGLKRTKVGNFSLKDAVGSELMEKFTIQSSICQMNEQLANIDKSFNKEDKKEVETEKYLQNKVLENIHSFNQDFAKECGFFSVQLLPEFEDNFFNGQKLRCKMFNNFNEFTTDKKYAVFNMGNKFLGVISADNQLKYDFVIH